MKHGLGIRRAACFYIRANPCQSVAKNPGTQSSIVPSKTKSAGPVSVTFLNWSPVFVETDLQFVPAADKHSDRTVDSLGRGKNERARDHAGAARQRFVLDATLVGADRNLAVTAAFQKIYVGALGREKFVMPDGGPDSPDIRLLQIVHRNDHVRHAAIHKMCVESADRPTES